MELFRFLLLVCNFLLRFYHLTSTEKQFNLYYYFYNKISTLSVAGSIQYQYHNTMLYQFFPLVIRMSIFSICLLKMNTFLSPDLKGYIVSCKGGAVLSIMGASLANILILPVLANHRTGLLHQPFLVLLCATFPAENSFKR